MLMLRETQSRWPIVQLFEAKTRSSFIKRLGNGRVRIKIIEPGQGSSGFYTPEVLERAANAGMFDNVPIYRNHPDTGQRTERPDIDLTVGYIEPGAQYLKNGPKGPGIYGIATILEPSRRMVYSMVDTPFGVSIHADGDLERMDDPTSRVMDITKVHSVDMVVKPGAGGAFVEVLESERLNPVHEEGFMRARLVEDNQGNQYLHIGNIYEDDDEFEEEELEERFDSLRRGASAAAGAVRGAAGRGRRAASSAAERGRRAASTAKDRGRQIASDPRARRAAMVGGGAAAGGAAGYAAGRRREEDIDEEEDNIYEDGNGNLFQYLGNVTEDLYEQPTTMASGDSDLRKMRDHYSAQPQAAGRGTGRIATLQRRASDVGERGRRAATAGAGMIRRNPLRAAGIAGAAGLAAGAIASRRKKESMDEEDLYEDDNGNQFLLVGNIYEDDILDDNSQMAESIQDIYEQLAEMQHGPERDRRLMETANLSALGSYGSRRIIEQMALRYADNPKEAQRIGRAVGQAIMEDRAARGSSWATAETPRWDAQTPPPRDEVAGFWSTGGGNASLNESQQGGGFNSAVIDEIFR